MKVTGHLYVAVFLASLTPGISAQQQTSARQDDLLQREARLEIHDVPLGRALQRLEANSGVRIAFSSDLIAGTGTVSCSCSDVTVREALDSLLTRTGLRYEAMRGRVIVRPTARERTAPASNSADGEPRGFGWIIGHVLAASDSQSILGSRISVSNLPGEVRTDSRGVFTLRLRPGTYDLVARSLGFAPATLEEINVVRSDTIRVTMYLTQVPLRLSEIVVTPGQYGVLEPVAISRQSLTRDEIELTPQLGEDVFRAVKRLPGIASDDISTKLNLRGSTDQQLLILLDGMELYEPYHLKDFDGALGIVDIHSIGNVDLRAGGFSVTHGDKLAGVFSMASREPPIQGTRTTLSLSITNASFMTQGAAASGDLQWLFSARRGYLDLVLRMTGDDDDLSPRYYDVFGKVQYMFHPRHRITVHALHASDNLRFHEDGDVVDGLDVRSGWSSSYGWLTWDAYPIRSLDLQTIVWAGRLSRERLGDFQDSDLYRGWEEFNVSDTREFEFAGARHDLTYHLGEAAMLKVGVEAKKVATEYDYYSSTQYGSSHDTIEVTLRPRGHEMNAYAAARVRPFAPFAFEAGLRYDRISHTDDNNWSPRILASLTLAENASLRASWGHYYQSHGVHELDVGDGEFEFLPAEHAQQLAVGLEYGFANEVNLRVEAYRRTTADQRPRFANAERELAAFPEAEWDRIRYDPGRGRSHGVEFLLQKTLGRRWAWSASYALAFAEDEVEATWVPRTLDQRHTVGIHSTYRPRNRWEVTWSWQFHTGWPATAGVFRVDTLPDGSLSHSTGFDQLNAERLPSYHRLDFRVTRSFPLARGVLQVYVDVFNAYGRNNLRSYDYVPTIHDDGSLTVARRDGDGLLPRLPSLGFRYEF